MDIAVHELGGHPLTLNIGQGTWLLEHRENQVMDGQYAEHIKDAARVLSRYVDVLAVRAFAAREAWGIDKQDPIINGFAKWSDVPVVNLEGAMHHPCQSLADMLTIRERLGEPKKKKIAITWAWHPKALPMAVPNSILTESAKAGMDVTLAHPEGWELDEDVMHGAEDLAGKQGGSVNVVHDMDAAVEDADVIYAKSWGSIAHYRDQETESRVKQRYRIQWRVQEKHLADDPDRFFMHCLPVRRGVVVDDAVLDSDQNAAYDEAENRLHVQKAMLLRILGKA
jgi:N-acetylornithine carbamoyltransferase